MTTGDGLLTHRALLATIDVVVPDSQTPYDMSRQPLIHPICRAINARTILTHNLPTPENLEPCLCRPLRSKQSAFLMMCKPGPRPSQIGDITLLLLISVILRYLRFQQNSLWFIFRLDKDLRVLLWPRISISPVSMNGWELGTGHDGQLRDKFARYVH